MSDEGSITPLGDFGKPITKAIGAIADYIDVRHEPTKIREIAKAYADAARTKATSDAEVAIIAANSAIEIRAIQLRAEERWRKKEERRQRNIESIAKKALAALPPPDQVNDEKPDEDWVHRFFEHCQDIGNEEMQVLWARLLAGEIAKPGSFSLQTLSVARLLRREEAELFTRFCRYVWYRHGHGLVPVVGNIDGVADLTPDLTFEDKTALDASGLIKFPLVVTLQSPEIKNYISHFSYNKEYFSLVFPSEYIHLPLSQALFTTVGKELATIAGFVPDEEYRDRVLAVWKRHQFIVAPAGNLLIISSPGQSSGIYRGFSDFFEAKRLDLS